MRAPVAKAVRKALAGQLRQARPHVRLESGSAVPPGWRSWRCSPGGKLHYFIMFEPRQLTDDCSLVLAWNTLPRLPGGGYPPPAPEHHSGLFLLHSLWAPRRIAGWCPSPGYRIDDGRLRLLADFCPPPVEGAVTRVPAPIDDAVEELVVYGIPWFREVANAQGEPLEPAGNEPYWLGAQ